MEYDIKQWSDIELEFMSGSLLIGNGSSISLDYSFSYQSLFDKAKQAGVFDQQAVDLFDKFNTSDFELILRMLWYSYQVNETLSVQNTVVTDLYENIRNALIQVVGSVHCDYIDIQDKLEKISDFSRTFNTILSLNYDLILYWAMMDSNNNVAQHRHRFKDCFSSGGGFDSDWSRFREPLHERDVTLVFWPHGNLMIGDHPIGGEKKFSSGTVSDLKNVVFQKWATGRFKPVFVSEGKSDQKRRTIGRSGYLSTVYHHVIPSLSGELVVYGWGFAENDIHILEAIRRSNINKIAVSIYKPQANAAVECPNIKHKIARVWKQQTPPDIVFFDAESSRLWANA